MCFDAAVALGNGACGPLLAAAGGAGGFEVDRADAALVGDMPVFIIHARDDEVVPFGPAEQLAREMKDRGQTVSFMALEGVGHFQMGAPPLQEAGEWVLERWAER